MREPATDSAQTDAARVRSVLARELDTISHYEALASASENPDVRAFFAHLASEEKEHVAEALQMLRRLDAPQNAHFERDVSAHLSSVGAGPSLQAPVSSPTPQSTAARPSPPSPAGIFTVGPLRVRR